MLRRCLLTLAAMFLSTSCMHRRVECIAHGGPTWREYRTQHFVVWSDLDRAEAEKQVLDLEALRQGVRWYFQLPPEGDDLTGVVMLASQAALEEFHEDLAGIMIHKELPEDEYFIASPSARDKWSTEHSTLAHEMAHRFSRTR